jgi:hypothetical protein
MLAPYREELNLGAKIDYEQSQARRARGSKRRKLIEAILVEKGPCTGCQKATACKEQKLACWQFAHWCDSLQTHVTSEMRKNAAIKTPTREIYSRVFTDAGE